MLACFKTDGNCLTCIDAFFKEITDMNPQNFIA